METTYYIVRETLILLQIIFPGDMDRPLKCPDLTPLDFFLEPFEETGNFLLSGFTIT